MVLEIQKRLKEVERDVRHKLKTTETVEVEPLKKDELLDIIESYTGINLRQRLPYYDAASSLGNAFESPKSLVEYLTSVYC